MHRLGLADAPGEARDDERHAAHARDRAQRNHCARKANDERKRGTLRMRSGYEFRW